MISLILSLWIQVQPAAAQDPSTCGRPVSCHPAHLKRWALCALEPGECTLLQQCAVGDNIPLVCNPS